MRVVVLYGTESGNAEMVADDVAATLEGLGWEPQIVAMDDEVERFELVGEGHVVLITSTYGEGGLPETAAPLYEALVAERPDLSEVAFAAFGLGDSSY